MFLLAIVLVALGAIPAEAGSFTLFGPQHYSRTTGPPDIFSNSFTEPDS